MDENESKSVKENEHINEVENSKGLEMNVWELEKEGKEVISIEENVNLKRNEYAKWLKRNLQGLEKEVYSIFIDGLPLSVFEEWLLQHFSRWDMATVYISRKTINGSPSLFVFDSRVVTQAN